MRGYQIGGAQFSDKHCNFLINAGDATAADVAALMAKPSAASVSSSASSYTTKSPW